MAPGPTVWTGPRDGRGPRGGGRSTGAPLPRGPTQSARACARGEWAVSMLLGSWRGSGSDGDSVVGRWVSRRFLVAKAGDESFGLPSGQWKEPGVSPRLKCLPAVSPFSGHTSRPHHNWFTYSSFTFHPLDLISRYILPGDPGQ